MSYLLDEKNADELLTTPIFYENLKVKVEFKKFLKLKGVKESSKGGLFSRSDNKPNRSLNEITNTAVSNYKKFLNHLQEYNAINSLFDKIEFVEEDITLDEHVTAYDLN